jgi:uncharacterized membrane protein (UPF0127 family)
MANRARIELEGGGVVCDECTVADRPWSRLRGLLGRSSLPAGEGLLLRPCGSVHTLFMRFPIDVVFCDRELRVLSVAESVRPWRAAVRRGAKVAVELAAGEARRRGVETGVRLRLVEPI